MRNKWLSLFLILGMVACQPKVSEQPNVSNSPSSETENNNSDPQTAPVQFIIRNMNTQKGVESATVELRNESIGPIQITTDETGLGVFDSLRLDQTYTVTISAPGYKPATRTVNPLQIQAENPNSGNDLLLGVDLEVESTTISGQVIGSDGQPLRHAVVFDGQSSALTNAQGQFTLSYPSPTQAFIQIAHTQHISQSQTHTVRLEEKKQIGTIRLAARSNPLVIGFDASKNPLGVSAGGGLSQLNTLMTSLSQEGYGVQSVQNINNSLLNLDVLVLPSPSGEYSVEEIGAIQAFVKSGKKLVVFGEWGGFGGYNVTSLNQVLSPFQMQVGGDTLRELNQNYLSITTFQEHPITANINTLKTYQSGTVQILNGSNSSIIARSTQNGFRIANFGSFGVAGAGIYGTGRVILIGDVSMALDGDSDGNGVANILEADNLTFLKQAMAW